MSTIYDVAKKAGVSPSTAARVLRSKGSASARARKSVLKAARQLGYIPNAHARSLRSKRTHAVGILVWDISNPVAATMVRGAFDACHKEGYHIILGNSYDEPEEGVAILDTFRQNHVDGIIIMVPMRAESKLNAALLKILSADIPMVLVERAPKELEVDQVIVSDWIKAGRLAVEHLVSLGHTQIAMIAGTPGVLTGEERIRGYREGLRTHRLPLREHYVVRGDFTEVGGESAMAHLLVLRDPPTAVFAANDRMAMGALEACRNHGRSVKVPEDISIVGYDDMPYARFLRPRLTTISVPYYEGGQTSATRLIARIRGDKGRTQTVMLEPKLVVRESTAAPKGGGQRP